RSSCDFCNGDSGERYHWSKLYDVLIRWTSARDVASERCDSPSSSPSRLGLLAGDVAGFPNGRRVFDDVVDISLSAVGGGTPLTPATNVSPNNMIGDGVANNDVPFLTRFPYLATPQSGNSTTGFPHQHHTMDALPALP